MRTELTTAVEHARFAVALTETGDQSLRIEALATYGLVDAITGGDEWRRTLSDAVGLELNADPIPLATTAVVRTCRQPVIGR